MGLDNAEFIISRYLILLILPMFYITRLMKEIAEESGRGLDLHTVLTFECLYMYVLTKNNRLIKNYLH
jgi:hypothetical protein